MPSDLLLNDDWLRPDWQLPHIRAFMTTRAGGVSKGLHASMNVGRAVNDDPLAVAENRARVSAALGAPALFMPQVHGASVLQLRPEHAAPDAQLPPADASISTSPTLGVAIQVADCLPVLFAAPGGVAGAHAGWRGLAGGVLENTVAALCKAAGCRPSEIHCWMGACIGAESFEVGADVRDAFRGDEALFLYRPNAAGEPRWRADLAGLAGRRLKALGVARVSGGGLCTLTDENPDGTSRFFSFRGERLGGPRGRMVAAIRLL
ncbi:peptidoglycan editing factor PgeF [soil metagenome]